MYSSWYFSYIKWNQFAVLIVYLTMSYLTSLLLPNSHIFMGRFFIVPISMHFLNGSNFRPRFNGNFQQSENILVSATISTTWKYGIVLEHFRHKCDLSFYRHHNKSVTEENYGLIFCQRIFWIVYPQYSKKFDKMFSICQFWFKRLSVNNYSIYKKDLIDISLSLF